MTDNLYPPMTRDLAQKRRDLAPEAQAAFDAFGKAVFADGALSAKMKQIVAVAVAHATQCPYCIKGHTKAALRAGATPRTPRWHCPCSRRKRRSKKGRKGGSEVCIKRAYDPPFVEDGMRVLVDRLWPRGLRRDDAKVDLWLKEVAPSAALRRRFAHDPAKWPEFQDRYRADWLAMRKWAS